MKTGPDVRLRLRVGSLLREARRDAEMLQTDVEAKTGVKQSHLSQIERGAMNLKLDTMRIIAEVYGLEPVVTLAPLERIMSPRKRRAKKPAKVSAKE